MKCFYHDDMDGRCSAAIVSFYTKNTNPQDYYEMNYDKEFPLDKIGQDEEVFIVDFSFTEKTMGILKGISKITNKLYWIDHHSSSINLINKYSELDKIKGIRDSSNSGAYLTWVYFYGDADIPLFIKLVSDYDTWKLKIRESTFFKLGIDSTNYNALDNIWKELYKEHKNQNNKNNLLQLIKNGETIKKYLDKDYEEKRKKNSYEVKFEGLKALVINEDSNSWVFGQEIKNYPIVINWVYANGLYKYSLYTEDSNVDCSKLAEKYGGGGHKGAAGFSSKEKII